MNRRSAFTLVELVVVILILGILAGVAAPKLLDTSGQATDNGLRQTLSTVRNAIEIYAARNSGAYPPCTGSGDDFKTAMQDYIRGEFPVCPLAGNNDSVISPSSDDPLVADNSSGWLYNPTTGEFICNSTATSNDGTTAYSSY